MKKRILKILYENQGNKPISASKIKKNIGDGYEVKLPQIEEYLNNLDESKYVRIEKNRIPKSKDSPIISYKKYAITEKGIKYVDYGFEDSEFSTPQNVFIAENIYLGDILNISYNIEEIVNKEIDDEIIKEKVKQYFNDLQLEISKEKLSKKRLKNLLSKISEVSISKITEAALSLIMKQFLNV